MSTQHGPDAVSSNDTILLGELWHRVPEFAKAMGELPLVTLADLGFKRSEQAAKAGCVLVRPHRRTSARSYSGLWLRPEDVPGALAFAKPYLEQARSQQARQVAEAAARRAQHEARMAQAPQEVLDTLAKATGMAASDISALLKPEQLDRYVACVRAGSSLLALVLRGAPRWHTKGHDGSGRYKVNGLVVEATEVPMAVLALLKGDAEGYLAALDARRAELIGVSEQVRREVMAGAPAWFSMRDSFEWAAHLNPKLRLPNPPAQHAMQWKLNKTLPKRMPVAYGGVEVRLPMALSGKTRNRLWAMHELAADQLVHLARQELSSAVVTQLDAAKQEFFAKNPYSTAQPDLGLDPPGWQAMLEQAFARAASAAREWSALPSGAQEALKEQGRLRRLHLQVKAMQDELPATLKDFYPAARALNRRITFIAGPTNSGKTHDALEQLRAAESGVYLGPLRLLALEVYETLKASGVATSLVTGEYVRLDAAARHISATVEMLDLEKTVDVAVLDEVQMLEDPERGSAWLQALLGAPARHLVVLGSPEVEQRVHELAKYLGEPLEVVHKERLTPLVVNDQPVALKRPVDGTAYIVFSRRSALALAATLRKSRDKGVSVIYGALSPEVRQEQARKFREGENPLLVATDAVGMGLNLPIRQIVFTTDVKWDGVSEIRLPAMLVHQIAGRAGRFGQHEVGYVAGINGEVHRRIRKALDRKPELKGHPLGVSITQAMAEVIARHLGTEQIEAVLRFFASHFRFEQWATARVTEEQLKMARLLNHRRIAFADKLRLVNAPAIYRDDVDFHLTEMLGALETGAPATTSWVEKGVAHGLEAMEAQVRSLTLYCWMHYRWPALFGRIDQALARVTELNAAITEALAREAGRLCRQCARPLAWDFPHGRCEPCFRSQRGSWNNYYDGYGDY